MSDIRVNGKRQDNMTLLDFIDLAKRTNAGLAQLIGRKDDGSPTFAIIAVVGKEETEELLALLGQMKTIEQ